MIGRNDPCHCGSGKKYKKCCCDKDEQAVIERFKQDTTGRDNHNFMKPLTTQNDIADWDDSSFDDNDNDDTFYDDMSSNVDPALIDPQPPLPDLTAEQNAIINNWFTSLPRNVEHNDPDDAVARIYSFMDEHPEQFLHLELDNSIIFEIGAGYSMKNRWDKYIQFLKNLRLKRPDMYQRCFDYLDDILICDEIAEKKNLSQSEYFSFYRKFTPCNTLHIDSLIRLFAWTNQENALFEFIGITKGLKWVPPYGSDNEPDLYWHVVKHIVDYTVNPLSPEESSKQIVATLTEFSECAFSDESEREFATEIQMARTTSFSWNMNTCKNKQDQLNFLITLSWCFFSFLYSTKNVPWIKARYLANRILDFFSYQSEVNKKGLSITVSEKEINAFVKKTYTVLFGCDSISSVAFLEALFHFAEFLDIHGQNAQMSSENIQKLCKKMYTHIIRNADSADPVLRLPVAVLTM